MFEVSVDSFTQQIQIVQRRLNRLYQDTNISVQQQAELLPLALKELGIFSEELQIAVEELQQQNVELAATRIALETERQHYQELFEFVLDGYVVTDIAGTIKEANKAVSGLLN